MSVVGLSALSFCSLARCSASQCKKGRKKKTHLAIAFVQLSSLVGLISVNVFKLFSTSSTIFEPALRAFSGV